MPSSNESELAGKKIVIVEDDSFLGTLVSKKLTEAKAKISLVNTGEKALDVISSVKPDIIILDLLLPGMSGFDILKNVKANVDLKKIPVVVFSNLGEEKDLKQATELGANAFLIKATINIEEIGTEIARVLAAAQK